MTTTVTEVTPQCGDAGCSFKVCYTLSNSGECEKGSSDTFSRACDNGVGDDLLEQCNQESILDSWDTIGESISGFSACQYVEAGGYAYFSSKDGLECSDSFAETLAIDGATGSSSVNYSCDPSDDLGVTGLLCSGGSECVFTVGPMPACQNDDSSTTEPSDASSLEQSVLSSTPPSPLPSDIPSLLPTMIADLPTELPTVLPVEEEAFLLPVPTVFPTGSPSEEPKLALSSCSSCSANRECASGFCRVVYGQGFCAEFSTGTMAVDCACFKDHHCTTGWCEDGECQQLKRYDMPCHRDRECESGHCASFFGLFGRCRRKYREDFNYYDRNFRK